MRYFIPDVAVSGKSFSVASIADGEATNIPPVVEFVFVGGYYSPGDGGDGSYYKVEDEPAHAGKFQSADGAWWELQHGNNSILQFGATKTGLEADANTNNTAIQNAIDFLNEGDSLDFARVLVYYEGDLAVNTNRLKFTNGWLKKATGAAKNGFVFGTINSNVDRFTMVDFEMDGNKEEFGVGQVGAGVIAYYAYRFNFINCDFHDFPDDGVKSIQSAYFTFLGGNYSYNFNAGIELNTYPVDVRTNLPPAVGINVPPMPGGYATIGARMIGNDDMGGGTLNGAGFLFNASRLDGFGDGPTIYDMVFAGLVMQNNILGIWTENYSNSSNNVVMAGIALRGDITDGTVDSKNGIGLISVDYATLSAIGIIDIGHYNPDPANTVGLTISATDPGNESQFINISNVNIIESQDAGFRMQYGANIQAVENSALSQVFIRGASANDYRIEDSNTSNLAISGAIGVDDEASWIKPLKLDFYANNIPADAGGYAFLPAPGSGNVTDPVAQGIPGRIVGLQVTTSDAIAAGNVTFKIFVNGVDIGADFYLTNADFAGGRIARVIVGNLNGFNIEDSSNVLVYASTDAGFLPITMDARAVVYIDTAVLN